MLIIALNLLLYVYNMRYRPTYANENIQLPHGHEVTQFLPAGHAQSDDLVPLTSRANLE